MNRADSKVTARFGHTRLPEEQRAALHKARKLEWLTIAFLAVTVTLVFLVLGSSQAMKAAWIEDLLSFLPPIAFLVAARVEPRCVDSLSLVSFDSNQYSVPTEFAHHPVTVVRARVRLLVRHGSIVPRLVGAPQTTGTSVPSHVPGYSRDLWFDRARRVGLGARPVDRAGPRSSP